MLGELNSHMDSGKETWIWVIGKNILSELNQSGVFLLNICARHGLTITMFEHKVVHECTCYHTTLGQRTLIDFFVISLELG